MFIFDQANKPTTWGLLMNGTEPQPYHMQAKVEKFRNKKTFPVMKKKYFFPIITNNPKNTKSLVEFDSGILEHLKKF